jgi:hypothetical protein
MNHSQHVSIKCPYCNLTNFASADYCKRCKNGLLPETHGMTAQSGEGQTININISIPASPGGAHQTQPNINVNGLLPSSPPPAVPRQQFYQTRPLPPQSRALPPTNSQYQTAPRQPGEYQLQNQTGFNQWQQMNVPPPPARAPFERAPEQGIYRRGPELIVHKFSALPAFCVKCNDDLLSAGGEYVKQKYRWHHGAVYAALISPLIYLILAAALSKRATLDLPLCGKHLDSRKTTGQFLIGGGVLSAIAIFLLMSAGSIGVGVLLFFVALIGITMIHEYSYKPLKASKIEDDYVYLKGVDKAFLNRIGY